MNDKMRSLAEAAARKYKKRCWWADEKELQQEAWVAILYAQKHFDPAVGIDFGAYAFRAATYALGHYLWKQSAPVSGGKLKGLYRAELTDVFVDAKPWADAIISDLSWRRRVEQNLRDVFEAEFDGELAALVLLEGQHPKVVAKKIGDSVHRVYHAVRRVRTAIQQDAVLWELWRNREERNLHRNEQDSRAQHTKPEQDVG